ncbi:MAG: DUF5947 family protein [Candidatus Dormibacteria bacterium]
MSAGAGAGSFASLRRLVPQREAGETCDLCAAPIAPEHRHLVEPAERRLVCACQPCSILFSSKADTRYRLVPDRVQVLDDLAMTDEQWEALSIPVNIAFFFHSTESERVCAFYPSPAGATESLLQLDAWMEVEALNPAIRDMEPEVEALLINRVGGKRQYLVAPIDECYALVGIVRAGWTGLSGGKEVWQAIDAHFDRLKGRARPKARRPTTDFSAAGRAAAAPAAAAAAAAIEAEAGGA